MSDLSGHRSDFVKLAKVFKRFKKMKFDLGFKIDMLLSYYLLPFMFVHLLLYYWLTLLESEVV